jgi:hypothetical protein
MFFSGVALPRWNDEGVCTFNGKLGMWAFVKKVCYTHTHTHIYIYIYQVFYLQYPHLETHIFVVVIRSQQREGVEIEQGEPWLPSQSKLTEIYDIISDYKTSAGYCGTLATRR